MGEKKLLIRIVILMLFMFALHSVAEGFYWYYSVWWFDMLMHFLGGAWVGLFFLYIFHRKNPEFSASLKALLYVILLVLLIGILWEVFELVVNNFIGKIPFSFSDTFSDICFDLAGGFLAIVYFLKRIMRGEESKI